MALTAVMWGVDASARLVHLGTCRSSLQNAVLGKKPERLGECPNVHSESKMILRSVQNTFAQGCVTLPPEDELLSVQFNIKDRYCIKASSITEAEMDLQVVQDRMSRVFHCFDPY